MYFGLHFKINRTDGITHSFIKYMLSEDMRCKVNASNRNESFTKIQMKTQPIEKQQVVQVATNEKS